MASNRFKAKRLIAGLYRPLSLLGLCALVLSVVNFFPHESFLLELGAHFRPHYALLGLVLLLYSAAAKGLVLALIGLSLLGSNAFAVGPVFWQRVDRVGDGPELSILIANVNAANGKFAQVRQLIEEIDPDVVGIFEVNRQWIGELERLSQSYLYSVISPREDNFGIALFSKLRLQQGIVKALGPRQPPTIVAGLEHSSGPAKLVLVHPLPPVSSDYYSRRNSQLSAVSQLVKGETEPLIVAGDFNCTPWAPSYLRYFRGGPLNSVRLGFGLLPTWPSFLGNFGLPIDHVLISKDFVAAEVSAVSVPGSDHHGVMVKLQRRILQNINLAKQPLT